MAAYSAAGLRQTTLKSCSNGNTRGKMVSFVLAICLGLLMRTCEAQGDPPKGRSSCYDRQGRAQRCMPEFVNAAFGLPVDATNTCGVSSTNEYCLQTGVTGVTKSCYYCDARRPGYNHPPEFMTDFNNNYNWTWWQSETMLEGVQYPVRVNLTLNLKKKYDITYVRIRFHSPRPESFAIYKRTSENEEWVPFQFYSASCERTYGLPRGGLVLRENEAVALCNDEHSDISPLTGGSVAFSTLEYRPSAFHYEDSPILQDWVTASGIRIVLTRMNTFGDEVFGDPQVLKSYFYAVSDLAVGARCKCNGHGSECKQVTSQGLEDELICTCEHNTHGPDCGECLPFYNDIPWARATESDAHECLPCDCNNLSNRCHFDQELYLRTGHGGHCDDCRDNTDGPHCERCLVNHYRRQPENRCIDCQCNPIGSESQQCNEQGQCRCKPGVTGDKCDRCEANYFDFDQYGCRPCSCNPSGSYNNEPRCDTRTGECTCKENVEGRTCDSCKPGFFGLSDSQPFGCVPCFCYGHSSICQSAPGYYARNISTDFETGKQRWTAVDRRNQEVATQYNGFTQNLGVSAPGSDALYFSAPARYLGDQRFSYNRFLTFRLRIGDATGARASIIDVVLEGSGQKVSGPIFAAGNRMPGLVDKTFRFRLHEHPDYQWSPRLKSSDFIAILSNLTAIKIRGTYTTEGVGFIDDIKMETARRGFNAGDGASWVEQCTCPEGYVGQFCESCAPGYKRDPMNGGPFAMCVPCECNGHSTNCDVNSGRCICQHNTEGDYCDRCVTGYYGNAREGTSNDCQPCPCPGGGACVQLPSDVVCTECPEGYGGNRCDLCLDGYFGDPTGKYGDRKTCQKCFCNDNIDPNAVGNCNATTGECLKCIHNTAGYYCERCLPTFYGDAIAEPKGQCQPCSCYTNGTNQVGLLTCDDSGQCPCLPNVRGRRCDMCDEGFWNLDSGTGCDACDCDRIGSLNFTCELHTGQCECKPGVTGRRCDTCQRFFYGFSRAGCQACNCDPVGSLDLQCDEYGNCPCRNNVGGRRCDRCMENKFNISAGCIDCPACYDLVQDQVNIHRAKLRDLTNLISNIGNNPSLFNDTKFISVMGEVNKTVNVLLDEARGASTGDGSVGRQIQELRKALSDVIFKTGQISMTISSARQVSTETENDLRQSEQAIERAEISLKAAEDYIDREGRLALDRALQALGRFGRQSEQMTEIANRAKLESERQMAEADRIVAVADDALNKSREALRLAQMAFGMPGQTARDIQRLNSEYNNADRLYEQTRQLAEKASELAEKAQDEALGLLTESQQRVPTVDVDRLVDDAANIKIQANLIKEEAERLLEQNADLMAEVTDGKTKAEDKLEAGIHLQQRTDELLAEVDGARAKARDAVEMGEKTLREANETYQTLAGFEDLVKGNKDKSDEALKKVPEIEGTIDQAERTTQEARNALSGATDDANKALELAKQAQGTAIWANDEASIIREAAAETKTKSSTLRNEADQLAEEVNAAESRFNAYDDQSTSDMDLAKTALEKANEAKDTAQKASSKVEVALNTVNDILQILDSFEMVDPSRLDTLEADLEEVERQLKEADIDAQYKYISSANDNVKNLVRKYRDDHSQLKKDVDNIEDIKDSLIDGCFKSIEIESPAGGR